MDSDAILELVARLRTVVADHPLWTCVAIVIALSVAARFWRRPVSAPGAAPAAAAFAIAAYASIAIWYAAIAPSYYDFAEPTVAAIAWLFARGEPMYHAVDAAARYSHIYGPLAFMIPGWSLALIGPSMAASKMIGAAAGLLSVMVLYRLMRSTAMTPRAALGLTGLFALLCLMFRNASFWIRPDSFSLLFAALALLATTSRHKWIAALGVGASAGVLLDLKLTGPLYALPAFALLWTRCGAAPLAGSIAMMLAIAIAPFAAWPNVSPDNYLTWLKTSAGNGLLLSVFRHNLEWSLFLLVPFVPTLPARSRLVYGALIAGITGVAIAASKPGAGPYHLLPFVPAVLYVIALQRIRIHAAFVAATVIVASIQQVYFIGVLRAARDADVAAMQDVTRLVESNPGRSMAMGYANAGERATFVRPLLVFRGNRYPIDAPAVQEFEMSGLDLPRATIEAMRGCEIDVWLMPKGAQPFDGPNKYPSTNLAPLFPETFKRAFADAYERDAARDTRAFDVWRCKARPAPASLR
jgi:hypothetical protein